MQLVTITINLNRLIFLIAELYHYQSQWLRNPITFTITKANIVHTYITIPSQQSRRLDIFLIFPFDIPL